LIKPGGKIKTLEIIQDCYTIYQHIAEELKLTDAPLAPKANELADHMAMLGVQSKKKNCVCIRKLWIFRRC